MLICISHKKMKVSCIEKLKYNQFERVYLLGLQLIISGIKYMAMRYTQAEMFPVLGLSAD